MERLRHFKQAHLLRVAASEVVEVLREEGVDLNGCEAVAGVPTGVALINVAASGENQIVVAPGANRAFNADTLVVPEADALLCQLDLFLSLSETG